jgi:hypothetical protein
MEGIDMRTVILIAILTCVLGCSRETTVTSRESLGKITDAAVVPTSFNEFPKMLIKTEKRAIVLYRVISVDLGVEAWSVSRSDGSKWLEWTGSTSSYKYY